MSSSSPSKPENKNPSPADASSGLPWWVYCGVAILLIAGCEMGMQLRLTPAGIDLAGEREREAAGVSAGVVAMVRAAGDGAEG